MVTTPYMLTRFWRFEKATYVTMDCISMTKTVNDLKLPKNPSQFCLLSRKIKFGFDIFDNFFKFRIGNKSQIRVTQTSFSLNWITFYSKTWTSFFEIEFKSKISFSCNDMIFYENFMTLSTTSLRKYFFGRLIWPHFYLSRMKKPVKYLGSNLIFCWHA